MKKKMADSMTTIYCLSRNKLSRECVWPVCGSDDCPSAGLNTEKITQAGTNWLLLTWNRYIKLYGKNSGDAKNKCFFF